MTCKYYAKALAIAMLCVTAEACLLAQAADTQRLAVLLKSARGQVQLTKPQFNEIQAGLLAWISTRLSRGATIAQLNEELAANGLIVPEELYDRGPLDDIYQPYAGYLTRITSEAIASAAELQQINIGIGMTCAFDQTAVIYRRDPFRRMGWINYRDTNGQLAWGVSSMTLGAPDAKGERIVAAALMHRWCTGAWGSIELRIWKLAADGLRPLLIRGLDARRDEPVATSVEGDIVTFRYHTGVVDARILIRDAIHKYRVDGDRATRIAPFAANILGFVHEWLTVGEAEAEQWSTPAAMGARAAAIAWEGGGSVTIGGSMRCAASPTLWQVSGIYEYFRRPVVEDDRRYFFVEEDGSQRLRMVGFARKPLRQCPAVDIPDVMAELPK